tara:strand:- start:508 stop:651 length:144 start_codon:yes stop_codon:yes gene_type:complete
MENADPSLCHYACGANGAILHTLWDLRKRNPVPKMLKRRKPFPRSET